MVKGAEPKLARRSTARPVKPHVAALPSCTGMLVPEASLVAGRRPAASTLGALVSTPYCAEAV